MQLETDLLRQLVRKLPPFSNSSTLKVSVPKNDKTFQLHNVGTKLKGNFKELNKESREKKWRSFNTKL